MELTEKQDGHITTGPKEQKPEDRQIRFITPEYKDLFTVEDGGHILVKLSNGVINEHIVHYVDPTHLKLGYNIYHICELAERLKRNGSVAYPFPEKRMIWSNIDLDLKDWIVDLKEEYPELSRDELYEKMYERNSDYLDDERINLNLQVGEEILVIADLGFWNGRHMGYKVIESGNLSDCLCAMSGCEYNEWFVDRDGEFRSNQTHHDGTHHFCYRTWKSDADEEQKEALLENIYAGKATPEDIDAITEKLGKAVGTVYGWDFPQCRTMEEK